MFWHIYWLVQIINDSREETHTNIVRRISKKKILVYITWKCYIGSYELSVFLAKQTYIHITRTK